MRYKMKQKLLKSLIAVMLLSVFQAVKAYDFKVDGVCYSILSENEMTVEVAPCPLSEGTYSEKIVIPETVSNNGIEYLVLNIGKRAFCDCEQIKSVSISNGVIEVGDESFKNCKGITSITLPSSVSVIGKNAFQNCQNLTSLTLRNANVYIGEKAFDNCQALGTLVIPNDSQIDVESFFNACGHIGGYTVRRFQSTASSNYQPQRRTKTNGGNTPNTQIYKGNFKMVGFGYGVNTDDIDGVATYHYRNAADGTRIFEGEFSFEGKSGYQSAVHYQANGMFKNNKQIGVWKWQIAGRGEDNTYCEITFDDNGVPNGKFNMWIGFSETVNRRSWMNGVFENGKLSFVSYRDRNNITAEGRYNKQGMPIGRWTLTGKGVQNHNCIFEFDESGHQTEAYYIDATTGDKVKVYSEYPQKIITIVISSITKRCFRSTPKVRF